MSPTYNDGDIIDLRIEKIVPRGYGIGFAEKLTVLVPRAVPGDILRVRLRSIKKRLAFADIVEVRTPGPGRIEPPCVYFGTCGGCDFQQMNYSAQLEAKVGLIRDCLRRIGKIEYEREIKIVGSPQRFGYRSRARWHLDRQNRFIGYTERESHDVVDVHACPILTPGLQAVLAATREGLDWNSLADRRAELEAATGDVGEASTYLVGASLPSSELSYSVGGNYYAFSARTFFQANKFLIPDLLQAAIGGASGETAFDLYCGVGLFTLPLARNFSRVVAVEENPAAADLAEQNAHHAAAENIEIVPLRVDTFLKSDRRFRPDFVLIDPPRSGPEMATIEALCDIRPAEISYVSCDPSILARDLRTLLDASYAIKEIVALDLFPQTHHVETVVRLKRRVGTVGD